MEYLKILLHRLQYHSSDNATIYHAHIEIHSSVHVLRQFRIIIFQYPQSVSI